MERVQQAKLKEEVAADGDMRGFGVAHKRHRKHKGPKKEERTKKPKDDEAMKTNKSKGDEAMGMLVVDAGSKEKCGKGRKTKKPKVDEAMKTKKPDGDDAMEMLVVDSGSKEKCGKGRKTKLVKWRLSRELLEYLRTKEVMGYIATEMPRLLWPNITGDLFDQKLKEEIAAQFEENREFDAYVLYQYRTKGYAEIQEEVDDAEV